jgi:hypothetical protein
MVKNRGNASRRGAKKISISVELTKLAASFEGQARSGVALTPAQRRVIQASPLSYRKLADLLHINPKTVAKWKHRTNFYGHSRGPRGGQSKFLTEDDEDKIAYYYAGAGKSIDKCLNDLKEKFPLLTRSTYWRCIRRVRLWDREKFDGFSPGGDFQVKGKTNSAPV